MKIQWFAAGIAAVLITGGAATVAQRVITQKTRGVLPAHNDPAHADSRRLALATPEGAASPPPSPPPAAEVALDRPIPLPPEAPLDLAPPTVAEAPPAPPASPAPVVMPGQPVEPTMAVGEPATGAPTEPAAEVAANPASDPAINRAIDSGTSAQVPKTDPVETVETFLENNRKEAEAAIQALTTEAENLKARLAKVETALVRWQNFAHALAADQPVAHSAPSVGAKPNWKRAEPESPAQLAPVTQPEMIHVSAPETAVTPALTEGPKPNGVPAGSAEPAVPTPAEPKPGELPPPTPENPPSPQP